MFDRTVVLAAPSRAQSHYHTHVEKRAPTDESVRLLKEFEEKAAAKVIEAIRVEDNGFKCVVHLNYEGMNDQHVLVAVYELNGVKHKTEARGRVASPDLLVALRDEMAKDIASQLLMTSCDPVLDALSRSHLAA